MIGSTIVNKKPGTGLPQEGMGNPAPLWLSYFFFLPPLDFFELPELLLFGAGLDFGELLAGFLLTELLL